MSHRDLVQQALRLLTHPIETGEAKEALKPQQGIDQDHAPKDSMIQPGDWIEWQRAGTVQQGLVDFFHDDADGTRWAFVTLADKTGAAVNVRAVTHPPVSPDAMAKQDEVM